jgi:integrase
VAQARSRRESPLYFPRGTERLAPRKLHAFRRTFLTQLAENGANPFAIRDLALHRSIVTTEGYLRLNLQHRPLVDALDS